MVQHRAVRQGRRIGAILSVFALTLSMGSVAFADEPPGDTQDAPAVAKLVAGSEGATEDTAKFAAEDPTPAPAKEPAVEPPTTEAPKTEPPADPAPTNDPEPTKAPEPSAPVEPKPSEEPAPTKNPEPEPLPSVEPAPDSKPDSKTTDEPEAVVEEESADAAIVPLAVGDPGELTIVLKNTVAPYAPLAGGVFEIRIDNSPVGVLGPEDTLVPGSTKTTTSTGTLVWSELAVGNYISVQTAAPDRFSRFNAVQPFSITVDVPEVELAFANGPYGGYQNVKDSSNPGDWSYKDNAGATGSHVKDLASSSYQDAQGKWHIKASWDTGGTSGGQGFSLEYTIAPERWSAGPNPVPQPDRSQGGTVLFIGEGSGHVSLAICTYGLNGANYPSKPPNGPTTNCLFYPAAVDRTTQYISIDQILPDGAGGSQGCPPTFGSTAYLRSWTGEVGNLQVWGAPIAFVPPSTCGALTIEKKDLTSGAKLSGATFTVTPNPATGSGTATVTTGANGTYFFPIAKPGTYTVTETSAPAGYELSSPVSQQITVASNQKNAKVTFNNPRKPGSVIWKKVNNDNPAGLLGGSEWTITGPGYPAPGTVIEDCVPADASCSGKLDKDPIAGQFKLEGLGWGTYTVVETKAPTGYLIGSGSTFTFTVSRDNAGTTQTAQGNPFVNLPATGGVKWEKVDDQTPKVNLGGSEWTITGPGHPAPGTLITDCISGTCSGLDIDNRPGYFELKDLAWGSYSVNETKPPTGHTGTNTFTFVVDKDTAGTVQAKGQYVNPRLSGTVTWVKHDQDGQLLAGSGWTVTGPGAGGPVLVVADCVAATDAACTGADKDPIAGQFKLVNLAWGTYTITESTVPQGYIGAEDGTFTISSENVKDPIVVTGSPFVNTQLLGQATWTKVNSAGDKLGDSQWTLTGPGHLAGTLVEDCDSGNIADCTGLDQDPDAGEFLIKDLAWGDYTLVEASAPPGHILDTTERHFTVASNNVPEAIHIGDFVNVPVTTPSIPLTGGIGRDTIELMGLGVLTLGFGAALAVRVSKRRKEVASA